MKYDTEELSNLVENYLDRKYLRDRWSKEPVKHSLFICSDEDRLKEIIQEYKQKNHETITSVHGEDWIYTYQNKDGNMAVTTDHELLETMKKYNPKSDVKLYGASLVYQYTRWE